MAVPKIVQGVRQMNANNLILDEATLPYLLPLPNASPGGNAIIVMAIWDPTGGFTASVTDDKSNHYFSLGSANDGSAKMEVFLATNVSGGTTLPQVNFSGAANFVKAEAWEIMNVVTASGSIVDTAAVTGSGSSSSFTTPALSTAVDGDIIFQFGFNDDNQQANYSHGTGWTLLDADHREGMGVQYQIQATHGSITPSLGYGTTGNYVSVAVALKSAAAGNDLPAGMNVIKCNQNNLNDSLATMTFQFPAVGNLLLAMFVGNNTNNVTAITDSLGNSWSKAISGSGPSDIGSCWFANNNSPADSLVITVKWSGAGVDSSDVMFYDVSGADTSAPLDTTSFSSGNQSAFSSPFTMGTITPTTSNGIVLCGVSVALNAVDSVTPGVFGVRNNNNGWANYNNPNTSTINFSWVTNQGQAPGGVGQWFAVAAAFKAPSQSGSASAEVGVITGTGMVKQVAQGWT